MNLAVKQKFWVGAVRSFIFSLPLASCSIYDCFGVVPLVQAQIVSDGTLPRTSDITQLSNIIEVTEGTVAGSNLFHSFMEFSVPEGIIARFINNNGAIQNVISRVTGTSASEISGRLEAGGTASHFNLFLMNPNGIIFGPNASLNLNGSFVATTANAIQFGPQGSFSASAPNNPSLLTVHPSAFLFNQMEIAIGSISNSKTGTNLEVPNEHSLLLLGGDVTLEGTSLTAPNGRVEVGGLGEGETVNLDINAKNLRLYFPMHGVRADVSLANQSIINVDGVGNGSVSVTARNIDISGDSSLQATIIGNSAPISSQLGEIVLDATGGLTISDSLILSQVFPGAVGDGAEIFVEAETLSLLDGAAFSSALLGQGNAGDIVINIRNAILLSDQSAINNILFGGEGQGGNISVKAKSLSLNNGSSVQAFTAGMGPAGNIDIKVRDFVSLTNTVELGSTQITTAVAPGGVGNSGTIFIESPSLSLANGSQLNAAVLPGGQGQGGNIVVQSSDSVNISGVGSNGLSSAFIAATVPEGVGPAGNISVTTNLLRVTDGAVISAQSLNPNPGGSITINANSFEALTGGQVITAASDIGNAGDITLNVTDRITLSGSDPTFSDRLAQFGSDVVPNQGPNSGLFASTSEGSTGNAGSIFVDPVTVEVLDGAQISVDSQGLGIGGNIELQAENLTLDQGVISAETISNQGGNLSLDIVDLLLLRNNSQISTTAGGNATGGNIDIDAAVIAAFPSENSDIAANAFAGTGGNVNITTQGLFGFDTTGQATPASGITASSELGVDGTVEINTPEVDPSQDLVNLPTVVDPGVEIAQDCRTGNSLVESSFIDTRRGGLPTDTSAVLSPPAVWEDTRDPSPATSSPSEPVQNNSEQLQDSVEDLTAGELVEAQGWVVGPEGDVVLVASAPIAELPAPAQPASTCQQG